MSSDNFTEVTSEGWLSRIGGALKGILIGLILFIVAFPLLIWNEGRAVDRIKTLEEGSGSVIHIDSSPVMPVNDKKLVHLTANVTTNETLEDPVFKVQANAIKLKRNIQIYQWNEKVTTKKEKQLGGGEKTIKEYSYSKVWSDNLINSDNFKDSGYHNPENAPFKKLTLKAKNITFDAFDFPDSLTSKMNNFKRVDLQSEAVPKIQGIENIISYAGGYFVGGNPETPKIGDIKVDFEMVEPGAVSIIAQQTKNTFQPFITSGGGELLLLEYGVASQAKMFKSALDNNTFLTWAIRIAGLIIMTLGLSLILKPLSVIADVLPILGNIVDAGAGLVAFLVAIVLTVITIAFAWLFFRPLIGGGLLLLAALVMWGIKGKVKRNKITTSSEATAA